MFFFREKRKYNFSFYFRSCDFLNLAVIHARPGGCSTTCSVAVVDVFSSFLIVSGSCVALSLCLSRSSCAFVSLWFMLFPSYLCSCFQFIPYSRSSSVVCRFRICSIIRVRFCVRVLLAAGGFLLGIQLLILCCSP